MSAVSLFKHLSYLSVAPAEVYARARSLGWRFILAVVVWSLVALLALPEGANAFLAKRADLTSTASVNPLVQEPGEDSLPVGHDDLTATHQFSADMQRVLNHVARRYRVASTNLVPILAAAQEAATARGIDPLLVVAVIGIESAFNPFAESSMGAQGLMQVIPRFHQDKVPENAGEHPFLDPVTNVRIGVEVLHEAIQMRGGLIPGLQQYGGSSDPAAGYANKVLAEKERLDRVAGRPVALRANSTEIGA